MNGKSGAEESGVLLVKPRGRAVDQTVADILMTDQQPEADNAVHSAQVTFKAKKCKRFVAHPQSPPGEVGLVCTCGRMRKHHDPAVLNVQLDETDGAEQKEWDPSEDVEYTTTDACGKINFNGKSTAKYVRIADDSNVSDVANFMLTTWGMKAPKLVISVVGGADGFDMTKWSGRWKRIMDAGLVKVAQDAGAWIITGGTNTGVMKAVAQAVQSGQSKVWIDRKEAHRVRCIGIWTWGATKDANKLINKENQARYIANYNYATAAESGRTALLNPQHTHFLLVDDGTVGYTGGIEDGLYSFRNNFENHLSNSSSEGSVTVPCVQLLVGGEGMGCIQQIRDTLRNGIPVVVCKNTGKACDLLCAARKLFNTIKSDTEDENLEDENVKDLIKVKDCLRSRLKSAYPWLENSLEKLEEYLQWLCDCCFDIKLITVFDFMKSEELDTALFMALFEGKNTTSYQKFMFAYHWNRADIAEKVLVDDTEGEIENRKGDLMKMALEEEKTEIVEILFKYGVNPKDFLTVHALEKFYLKLDSKNTYPILFKCTGVKDEQFRLSHVDQLIRQIKGGHIRPVAYRAAGKKLAEDVICFKDPFVELFIWAVLAQKQELAKLLWQSTEEPVMAAVLAYHLLSYLNTMVEEHDSDIKLQLQENAQEFQELANGLLDECYSIERSLAQDVVQVRYERFNHENVLDMAAGADAEIIIAHPACQNSLNSTWRRGLTSSVWLVVLATIFPFLIPLKSLKFSSKKLFNRHIGGNPCGCCRFTNKAYMFYTLPLVKFTLNSIAQVVMCVLFSYFVLFGFRPHVTVVEIILVAWTVTLLLEEIREIIFMFSTETLQKIRQYIWNMWNKMDLLGILLVVLAFSLRWTESTMEVARTLYCLSCLVWCLRLLYIYTPSSYFGTKLIMIYKMLSEVVFFMLVMLVFLVSYGVVSQALMFPLRSPYPLIIKDVLYMPYWQIYGELFLEEMNGKEDCTNTTLTVGMHCAQSHWLVPILLAAYLIIGNVLMLNLLIAIMSHVFEEVQSKSEQVWKSAVYDLVREYEHKPCLPPPFIILGHIHGVFLWIQKKCGRCNPYQKPMKYPDADKMRLRNFLNDCMENYMNTQKLIKDENEMSILKSLQTQQDQFVKEQKEERRRRHFHVNSPANTTMSQSSSFMSNFDSAFSMGDFHLGKGGSQNTPGDSQGEGKGNPVEEKVDLVAVQKALRRMTKALEIISNQVESALGQGDEDDE